MVPKVEDTELKSDGREELKRESYLFYSFSIRTCSQKLAKGEGEKEILAKVTEKPNLKQYLERKVGRQKKKEIKQMDEVEAERQSKMQIEKRLSGTDRNTDRHTDM